MAAAAAAAAEEEPQQKRATLMSFGAAAETAIPDVAMERVLGYIEEPRDRAAVSLVCRRWHRLDALTRKHVTVAFCYSASPASLRRRFSRLESLKLKAKPRAAMFNLIPEDWGGHAGPWLAQIAAGFDCLRALHLRRMVVDDAGVATLARSRGHMLHSLRLDKCSGFSTHSLRLLARSCRCLRTMFLEESTIVEHDGEWLRELAVNNSVLETLNFYMTDLKVSPQDLELLARNCKSLLSLKISDCDVSHLAGFFQAARVLEEFGGGSFTDGDANKYNAVTFPPRLISLGLFFMGTNEMPTIFSVCAAIKKLDLQYAFLSTEDHCQLIQRCPNLEVLETRNVIGDRGLGALAQTCRKLRRLRIERGEDEQDLEDEQGKVSQVGLSALALACPELEYLAVYASDITNAALECIGMYSKKLIDFRFVLLDKEDQITELPLDNGVRALLRGCTSLQRFSFYLRPGGLSDVGLGYIGEFSGNIRYMLLGNVGESDEGLLQFARGCSNLQKLELRSCRFSEGALAHAALQLHSLRYLWVQGYQSSPNGRNLMVMARPFWNIEFVPPRMDGDGAVNGMEERQAQILAYYSLAGRRSDLPESVVCLHP